MSVSVSTFFASLAMLCALSVFYSAYSITEKKSSRRQNLLFGPSCNGIFCLRVDFLGVYDLTFTCLRVDFYFVYEYDILSTSRSVYESVCLRVDSLPIIPPFDFGSFCNDRNQRKSEARCATWKFYPVIAELFVLADIRSKSPRP